MYYEKKETKSVIGTQNWLYYLQCDKMKQGVTQRVSRGYLSSCIQGEKT